VCLSTNIYYCFLYTKADLKSEHDNPPYRLHVCTRAEKLHLKKSFEVLTTQQFSKVYIIFGPGNVRLCDQQLLSLVINVVGTAGSYTITWRIYLMQVM
jgi:hypothetical protein